MSYGNKNIDRLLNPEPMANPIYPRELFSDFSEQDWREFAVVCADQGMATIREQQAIAAILDCEPNHLKGKS